MASDDLGHFDLCGHLDGYRVSYRGQTVAITQTLTGAARAMTAASEALRLLQADARCSHLNRKAA